MLRHLVMAGGVLLLGQAPPAPSSPAPPERPPGERFTLTDGELFVPTGFQVGEGGYDLTLHLHGAAWAAERNLVQARQPGVLVTVVLPGLSDVYTRKFREPGVFTRILEETRSRLAALAGAKQPHLAHLVVTSFSAGFGGVRELLKDPAAFERIDALVMADSIHAGFTGDPAGRQVNPEQMEGFLRFARAAVDGRKCLIISHSRIQPPNYASTTETADYLLQTLGGSRESVSATWPGDLALESRFRRGRLEVYGFSGDTGPDHMKHLQQLWTLLERVRLNEAPSNSG
jgi:hypothetical protein